MEGDDSVPAGSTRAVRTVRIAVCEWLAYRYANDSHRLMREARMPVSAVFEQ